MTELIAHLAAQLRHRRRALRRSGEAGYSTETVLVTALLAALALAVLGILAAKVIGKASSINLG